MGQAALSFQEAVQGLIAGDFSRLAPLFETPADGSACAIVRWLDEGCFESEPAALAEAFTCACFNGRVDVVEHLLASGVDPSGGMGTGMNAFHWAANRGQAKVVDILIQRRAPLEVLNHYGGTVLGCAWWSAIHEPRPDHAEIIRTLIKAGADLGAAGYPSGDERFDEMIKSALPLLIKFATTAEEIQQCFPVIAQLRPQLAEAEFQATVARLAETTGFKLAYLSDGGIKAVAGCRVAEWLHSGRYMEIEDLITSHTERSKGYGAQLFHWLLREARREGCRQLRLVSGVQRADAHRFYERLGMVYEAKYFSLAIR